MIGKWYPPARLIFMPLYRRYRRWFGNKRSAFVALMATSGVLHVMLFALLGHMFRRDATPVLVFVAGFYSLLTLLAAMLADTRRKPKD
ncbi:hypothetical protein [Burkholderia gladioli]|uniref:hypothetical protein n=1 Tax=Burkholderia gladioli TaxID=28095 RepID=UPI0016411EC1|nr:hypothetical protein [Burkholderia gladioli]